MKKLVVMLLAATLSLSTLAGCGEKKPAQNTSVGNEVSQEKQNDTEEYIEDEDVSEAEAEEDNSNVRKNGELPSDKNELTDEEVSYHLGKIFKALQNLDVETLAEYTNSDYTLENLEELRADAEAVEFWNAVVGDMVYFEECDILLAKSSDYIYSKWFTQSWQNGAELEEYVEDMDKEEVLAIYDKYYAEAPWVCGSLKDTLLGWDVSIEDGYLKCNLDRILSDIGYEDLGNLMEYGETLNYGELLMGDQILSLGYDHILEDMPNYATILSMKLDDIVALAEAQISEDEKFGFSYDCYVDYYVPEASRAMIQKYIDENVECYREMSHLVAFAPANFDDVYPLYYATDEVRSELEKYDIVQKYYIYEFTENFDNNFELFYDAAETLIDSGVLE